MTVHLEATVETALGPLRIIERSGVIIGLTWGRGACESTPLLNEAAEQLQAYARRELHQFDLPLAAIGAKFQEAVWNEMLKIPYGETRTYGDLATVLNAMPQAVGGACGANPIPIIIPCHRVVASGGELGGFSGGAGVETKRQLLIHEGAIAEQLSLF